MTDTLDHAAAVFSDAVIEEHAAGVYRANRSTVTDEDSVEFQTNLVGDLGARGAHPRAGSSSLRRRTPAIPLPATES